MNSCTEPRLIVTGQVSSGAIFVSDQTVATIDLAGNSVQARFLWGRDDVAHFPEAGLPPPLAGALPTSGGWRFSTLTIDAGATRDYHAFIVKALGPLAEPDNPGFHTTPTLDLVTILDGELVLELDRGQERLLRRGDSAILHGVRHRWHNRGPSAATLVAVMIGAITGDIRKP